MKEGSIKKIILEDYNNSEEDIYCHRGIYPPECFEKVSKYGLSMIVTSDEKLKSYLTNVLSQLSEWLLKGEVQKLVVIIGGVNSKEVLERWVFNIETEKSTTNAEPVSMKPMNEIVAEIQAIVRQITATVTFLPLLNEPCSFDLLIYTDQESDVPMTWEISDPKLIVDSSEVRLRSFTTKIHKVDSMVAFKNPME